jgi:hypothetical protein
MKYFLRAFTPTKNRRLNELVGFLLCSRRGRDRWPASGASLCRALQDEDFSNWLAETYLEGESGLRNRSLIVFSFPSTLFLCVLRVLCRKWISQLLKLTYASAGDKRPLPWPRGLLHRI